MSIQERAVRFALDAHAGQVDKAGLPYFLHVLRVANSFRATPDVYAAAVMHDVIEDTFGTDHQVDECMIAVRFGRSVAQTVEALTRREPGMVYLSPDGTSRVTVTAHEKYLEEYIPRVAQHSIARYIKIEDLKDNLDPNRCVGCESLHTRYRAALHFLGF